MSNTGESSRIQLKRCVSESYCSLLNSNSISILIANDVCPKYTKLDF